MVKCWLFVVGTHVENKFLYRESRTKFGGFIIFSSFEIGHEMFHFKYFYMMLIWCVCLPNKTMTKMAKTMTWFNYHIHPGFCQRACSILGHGSCSGSILLCQVLDKRDATFWSCGVQEEWLPCDLKDQVVGKHLHGFFQMALSNKTPEEEQTHSS